MAAVASLRCKLGQLGPFSCRHRQQPGAVRDASFGVVGLDPVPQGRVV